LFDFELVLEYFSGGIEHGHVHVHKGQAFPLILFLALSVHSIIEGIPLGNQYAGIISEHQHANGSLFWGIIFHQIPVSIALMTLLISTKLSNLYSWLVLLAFAAMTPIGVLFGFYISPSQIGLDVPIILAVVVGMFLHISTTIIVETSENHKFNFIKLIESISCIFFPHCIKSVCGVDLIICSIFTIFFIRFIDDVSNFFSFIV
jgi:zinc transporter ZupT